MGFFSSLFGGGQDSKPGITFSVSCEQYSVEYSDRQIDLLKNGCVEDSEHYIYPEGTVWAGKRAKVYHHSDCCCGTVHPEWVALPECEAVRRGLKRCSRCDWKNKPVPAPCWREKKPARPLCRAAVKRVR